MTFSNVLLRHYRIVKIEEEHYDMPNYSCNANNGDENVRNSNIYDFIPDSGNCSEQTLPASTAQLKKTITLRP